MTFYPNQAELLGREMRRSYLEEAERQRLIRTATLANPPRTRKAWLILRNRWAAFWKGKRERKVYHPVSAVPRNSHSV